MNIKVAFTYNGKQYCFDRNEANLDRNYNDEPYALIFEDVEKGKEEPYFEINILKDAEIDGNLIEKGYVAVYETLDNVMAGELIDADVEFH